MIDFCFISPNDQPTDLEDSHSTLWKIIIGLLTSPTPRQKLDYVNTLDDVVGLMKTCKNIVVLTGAGVSILGYTLQSSKKRPVIHRSRCLADDIFFYSFQIYFFKYSRTYTAARTQKNSQLYAGQNVWRMIVKIFFFQIWPVNIHVRSKPYLNGQVPNLAAHWPLTGQYFEPWHCIFCCKIFLLKRFKLFIM